MDKKNLMPQAAQPVSRTTTGQLPPELAELSEEALQLYGEGSRERCSASVLPGIENPSLCGLEPYYSCSYDGEDAE
jgi:bacteriocin leader peptide (microcyclamide/patellamide family)